MSTSASPVHNQDIDPTLDALIDPALEDPDHLQALQNVANAHAVTEATEAGQAAVPVTAPPPGSDATTPMLPKPKRTLVRGSAADFRRREANRLAADRSRIRASEKRASLETAYATLTEDNARLKAEIEKLEREAGHAGVPVPVPEEEPEVSSGDHAQDSHSRTILAALMSAGQHETFETDMAHALEGVGSGDDSWMQGMEDMLKDAESSGRLGELARLAAGRNGPADGDGEEGLHGDVHVEAPAVIGDAPMDGTAEEMATDTTDRPEQAVSGPMETEPAKDGEPNMDNTDRTHEGASTPAAVALKKVEYDADAALAAATSKIAVTINADMEKIIRDELAVTKAVLASVNKEIARLEALSEEERKVEAWKRDPERVACLPNDVFSDDGATLKLLADTGKAEVETLEARLPEFRGKVRAARGGKLREEGQLATVVMRLQKLAVYGDHDDEGRSRTEKVLKGLTGYVGQLLGTAAELPSNEDGQNGHGSYLSAAFARRRRGRPPKIAPPGSIIDHTQAGPSSSGLAGIHDEANGDDASDPKHLRSRSRLVQRLAEAFQISQAAEEGRAAEGSGSRDSQLLAQLQKGIALEDMLDGTTRAEQSGASAEEQQAKESVFSRWKKGPPGSCDVCGRTETTVWRKLKFGEDNLKVCNPCGLYHAKFHVIRPPELWGDGKNIKKRRAALRARKSEGEDGATPKKKRQKMSGGPDGDATPVEDDNGDEVVEGEVDAQEGEGQSVQTLNAQVESIDPVLMTEESHGDLESAAQAKEVAALNEAILGGARDAEQGMEGLEGVGTYDEGQLGGMLAIGSG